MQQIVVIGASLAGLRACESLRSNGFDGTIVLIGAETELPYDRPPLSKKVLAGEWDTDRIRLRSADEFESLRLDLRLGVRATALHTDRRVVAVDTVDGPAEVAYDGLVIATGAHTRTLPHQEGIDGVFTLRTLDDSLSLRAALVPHADGTPCRVTVIGAGFIGLEVAATARQAGCDVTVLEGLPAPLVRGLGAEMGTLVAAVHTRNGVHLRCGVRVAGLDTRNGRVVGVRLDTDEVVASDVVVVGIGVSPSTEWLADSTLTLRDGIVCDATLNAGVPGVYAAGDCVRWPNAAFGGDGIDPADTEMRVEHWTNAAEQGAAAAANLLAVARGEAPTPFESVPFFWSDQFDSRIQFVGRAHGDDEVHVFAGNTDGAFAALYGYDGRFRGVLGVSMPRMVMPFRALLAQKASWSEALAKAAELTAPKH